MLDGKMQARIVSPRKVMFLWDSSQLPKQLFHHYFNINLDHLVHLIRIYDVTQIQFNGKNAHRIYDIPVPFRQGYWFVKGLHANRSYLAEMGVYFSTGEFFPLQRSNLIRMSKLEKASNNEYNQNVFQLCQNEEQQPKWREYVSTYSYYLANESDGREND